MPHHEISRHRRYEQTTNENRPESFWERRTLCEKVLCFLCVLAAIAIAALALGLYVAIVIHRQHDTGAPHKQLHAEALHSAPENSADQIQPQNVVVAAGELELKSPSTTSLSDPSNPQSGSSDDGSDLCVTHGCIKAAASVLDSIDESIDPCDNFYEFACGAYLKNTFIPDDRVTIDSFSVVRDTVQDQLRRIINEEEQPDESKPFVLAKRLNKACLNKTIIEQRGIKPLADMLESYGGWPAVKGDLWSADGFDWLDMIKKFRQTGLDTSIIFSFAVTTNLKNSTARVLDIDTTGLGLDREFLIKGMEEKNVNAYFEFMVDNAIIFGASRERAEKELLESLEFETRLANISLPREERRNATALYNPFTIKELQEAYPYLNWLDYINAMLPAAVQVDENETVINSVPKFFEELGAILESTPKRTMANYFLWRIVLTTSGTLTNKLRQRKLAYFTTLYGQLGEEPRWKECVQFSSDNLPISVGALYIRKYFTEESKNAALELVNNIRDEFVEILHQISWMDEETRKTAIAKANALTKHIGYPDELADNAKLEEYYKDLDIEADNLLLDTLRLNVFRTNYAYGKLREPVNKTDWVTHSKPALVNAFYSALENSIQFPAAIWQGRFFSVDRPRYMNYASIGQVIGHEITHGFDDQGKQFDADGNLFDWWDETTQKLFLEKAQCIIDQYGNFTDAETQLHLNGINTQGENIADNGGIKEAYLAYHKWVKRNGPEQKLPGLKYTPTQLFWISGAQQWCAVARANYNKNKITTGVHSPNEFRVIGPLSNTRDFSFDFNCPEGTKMNPVQKCEVW